MRRRRGVAVDRADVQVGVLRGTNYPRGHHLLVGAGERGALAQLLAAAAPDVGDGRPWADGKPPVLLNVAVSARGLRHLGVPAADVAAFGEAFVAGMASRAELLGDTGEAAPSRWDPPGLVGAVAAVLWLSARRDEDLAGAVARWRKAIDRLGLPLVHELGTAMHAGAREHFGFADGFGQPRYAGVHHDPGESGTEAGRDRPVATGELLFGHRDAMGQLGPAGRLPLARNGTMLVWRQLRQDVAGFRRAVARWGERAGLSGDEMAARLVGRWQDGTPLAVAPDAPPEQPVAGRAALDDYRYGDDPLGVRCPVGSHVRRANPRDGLAFPSMTTRHRIVRRGQPYGPVLPAGGPTTAPTAGCCSSASGRASSGSSSSSCGCGSTTARGCAAATTATRCSAPRAAAVASSSPAATRSCSTASARSSRPAAASTSSSPA